MELGELACACFNRFDHHFSDGGGGAGLDGLSGGESGAWGEGDAIVGDDSFDEAGGDIAAVIGDDGDELGDL